MDRRRRCAHPSGSRQRCVGARLVVDVVEGGRSLRGARGRLRDGGFRYGWGRDQAGAPPWCRRRLTQYRGRFELWRGAHLRARRAIVRADRGRGCFELAAPPTGGGDMNDKAANVRARLAHAEPEVRRVATQEIPSLRAPESCDLLLLALG